MKFRKASIEIVRNGRGYKTPKNKEFLDEFIASGMECAEVEYEGVRTPNSMYSSLKESIDRFHLDSIGVCTKDGKVYVFQKGAVK